MIKPLLALVFVFMLAAPSLAVVVNNITYATQDTFYPSNANGCTYFGADDWNQSVVQGSKPYVVVACAAGDTTYSMIQFDATMILNKLVLGGFSQVLTVTSIVNETYTPTPQNVSISYDNSWNESQVTPPLAIAYTFGQMGITQNSVGVMFNTAFPLDNRTLGALYANPGNLLTLTTKSQNSGGADGYESAFASRENGTFLPAFLNFTLGDFQSIESDNALLAGSKVYYDFDSQTAAGINFPQADFVYDSFVNTITPINGVTMSLPFAEQDTSNTLGTTNCFSGQTYGTGTVGSINFPSGNYVVACFNLSSQHAGRNFLAAIKVLNATPTAFNFFAAQYSPQFATLSTPTVIPNPMVAGQNAAVSWTSSTPTTTILHYFYTLNGAVSSIAEITDSNFTISHSVTIPGNQILDGSIFSVSPSGVDSFGNFYNSPYFNFTAVSPVSVLAIQGLGVFTFNQFGFPVPAGISLDGQQAIPTSQFMNTNNVSVFGVAFPPNAVPVGIHNISATSYSPTGLSGVTTITVTGYPKYVSISLRPHNSCVATDFFPTQDQCNLTMTLTNFSNVGATGKYCQYNPGECNQYNFTDGSCLLTAGQRTPPLSYILYTCYDNFNPTSVTIGADGNQGYVVPVGTATQGQNQGTTAFSVLGFDSEQTLNFIAMLISMLVTIAVGLLTKDVGVTGIVFIGMTGIFTLLTWLPWWFLLIEVVLTSFLVAKFFRGIFTPQ